jgi:hypothetical protein
LPIELDNTGAGCYSVRLGCKYMAGTNTLAYFAEASVAKKKTVLKY